MAIGSLLNFNKILISLDLLFLVFHKLWDEELSILNFLNLFKQNGEIVKVDKYVFE